MRGLSKFRFLSTIAVAFVLVNSLGIDFSTVLSGQVQGDRVEARSSGGRSRGGGFSRPSRSGGSSGGSGGSSGGSSGSSGGGSYRPAPAPYNNRPYYNPGPAVPVPVPYGGGGYYSTGGSSFFGLLVLLILFIVLPIGVMYMIRAARQNAAGGRNIAGGGNRELQNDIVTVTRLQVALLAQARYVQERLTELTLSVDTETPEGLTELLRETVLALMRSPENWSHVRASSQTVKSRQEAAQLFEKLSIEERSKFSAETLAKVGGKIRRQAVKVDEDEGPASYIVVTLLIGTEDDRPIIPESIHSSAELQTTLQRIGGITSDYLLIYELLWSPQEASDSLTYDELLSEYPDLVQL